MNGQPYWSGESRGVAGQLEWSKLLVKYSELVLCTGNNLGKSHFTYSAALWWACTRPHSLCLVFAPSLATLLENSWAGFSRLLNGYWFEGKEYRPAINLGARISKGGNSRPSVSFPNGSRILGIAADREENAQGFHNPDLFAIVEEASGIKEHVWSALGGLGARKTLLVGNPLSTQCGFYERFLIGQDSVKKGLPPETSAYSVQVPSTASPHASLERSPWGIADRAFLQKAKNEYGESSPWYRVHILAQFPSVESEAVFDPASLDYALSDECRRAVEAYRARRNTDNHIVIACDVGLGVGKSKSVIIVRDAYGILEIIGDSALNIPETAEKVAALKAKYNLPDSHLSYDANGDTGTRMGEALRNQGIVNAWQYFGSDTSNAKFGKSYLNARSATAFCFARRLQRDYFPGLEKGTPFSLPADYHDIKSVIEELNAARGVFRGDGKAALESKEVMSAKLKRSGDYFDALCQSFLREASRR